MVSNDDFDGKATYLNWNLNRNTPNQLYSLFISIGKAQHNDWFDSQPSTSSSYSSDDETLNPAKIVEKDSKTIEKVSKIVEKGSKTNYDSIETSSTSEEEEDISLKLQLLNQFPICDRFNKNAQIAKGSDFVFQIFS